jgi:hypothetical protein
MAPARTHRAGCCEHLVPARQACIWHNEGNVEGARVIVEVLRMRSRFRKLTLIVAFGSALPATGFAHVLPPACKTILTRMDVSVQNGGPTMHRYCGRYANGGEYLVVAYSSLGGTYTAYVATQSGQDVKAAPATRRNGVLRWHAVIAGITRTVIVTYRFGPNRVLTRIARGTEGPTIVLKTDPLLQM